MDDPTRTFPAGGEDRVGLLMLEYLEGRASAEEVHELSAMMHSNPELCADFARMAMNAGILQQLPAEAVPLDTPVRTIRRIAPLGLAAVILLALTAWFTMTGREAGPSAHTTGQPAPAIAVLTNTQNAVFAGGAEPMTLGSDLAAGPIRLVSGKAQIMLASTAVVDLIGPCAFEMTGPNGGFLTSGAIEATASQRARGFTIQAPGGVRVTDLGTRFRMSVDDQGRTQVYVVDGLVRMDRSNEQGGEAASLQLAQHQAGAFDPAQASPVRTIDAGTFLRDWGRRTGEREIIASPINAALRDTDADGRGDSIFTQARDTVAIGEQNNEVDRYPLRYYLPFALTVTERAEIESARRIELVLTLDRSQNVDSLSLQVVGLPGHAVVPAAPVDYHSPGDLLIDAAITAATPRGPVRLDVTDFVRQQARAGDSVVFRGQVVGAPLPRLDQKLNNFILCTATHPEDEKRPRLILQW